MQHRTLAAAMSAWKAAHAHHLEAAASAQKAVHHWQALHASQALKAWREAAVKRGQMRATLRGDSPGWSAAYTVCRLVDQKQCLLRLLPGNTQTAGRCDCFGPGHVNLVSDALS